MNAWTPTRGHGNLAAGEGKKRAACGITPPCVGLASTRACAEAGETSAVLRIFVDTKALHGDI
jgi:hypothetical protein